MLKIKIILAIHKLMCLQNNKFYEKINSNYVLIFYSYTVQ